MTAATLASAPSSDHAAATGRRIDAGRAFGPIPIHDPARTDIPALGGHQ